VSREGQDIPGADQAASLPTAAGFDEGFTAIGVDFSTVAIQQASDRAALFGLAEAARFVVGDLTATGLADAIADAVASIDALHFAVALDLGAPAEDAALAALQDEAGQRLPIAELVDRVVVTATRPNGGGAAGGGGRVNVAGR
jgi:hypothetical protein